MAEITWKSILTKLVGGDHLTAEESEWSVDDLMQGNANPAAVGAALAMQQQLGLTADEVRGAAKAMVSHAVPLNVSGETTDIVGTGGDGFATVNLSTMGSVAAAAAGVKIVKHGNRAASSKCGAADVLEDLGLPLDLKPEAVGEVGDEVGITFAFARTFHPAMRFVGPIRAVLGIPCQIPLCAAQSLPQMAGIARHPPQTHRTASHMPEPMPALPMPQCMAEKSHVCSLQSQRWPPPYRPKAPQSCRQSSDSMPQTPPVE